MRRNHSHHNNRPSHEQKFKHASNPVTIGTCAVAHTTIVASNPNHVIGITKTSEQPIFDNPDYFKSIKGEKLASTVLDSTAGEDSSYRRRAGEEILQSIDTDTDSDAIVGLKQLGAVICGVRHVNPNYEQIIEALDGTLNADELRDYISCVYEWSHEDHQDSEEYVNNLMTALSGFRVEASFTRLAQAAGFTVRQATSREDHRGVDFYVNDIPFDIKSSEKTALRYRDKYRSKTRRYCCVMFVPAISLDDFAGRLVIPHENTEHILMSTSFKESVSNAISQFQQANT